jgi:hypothetical protein
MMHTLSGVLAGLSMFAALVTSLLAWQGRSPLGEAKGRRVVLLGRLAPREYFTSVGWRYKQASLLLQLAVILLAIAWVRSAR